MFNILRVKSSRILKVNRTVCGLVIDNSSSIRKVLLLDLKLSLKGKGKHTGLFWRHRAPFDSPSAVS